MSRLYFILILLPCTLALIRPPKKNTLRDDEINKLVAEIGKLDKNFPDLKSTADVGHLKKVFHEIIAHFNPNYKIPADAQLTEDEKTIIAKRLEKINQKYQTLKDLKLQLIEKLSDQIQKIENAEKEKYSKKHSADDVDEDDTTDANEETTALTGNDKNTSSSPSVVNETISKSTANDEVTTAAVAANIENSSSSVAANEVGVPAVVTDDDASKPTASSA